MNVIILVVLPVVLAVALVYLFSICHLNPFEVPMDECEDDCETCEFRDSEDCMSAIAEKYHNEDENDIKDKFERK